MTWPIKCSCGDDSRYQNMANGSFIYTCGKRGCKKEQSARMSSGTGRTLNGRPYVTRSEKDRRKAALSEFKFK